MLDRESTLAERAAGPGLTDLLRHPSITSRLGERWNRWEAAVAAAIRIAAAAAEKQPKERKQIAEQVFDLLASGLGRYGAEPW